MAGHADVIEWLMQTMRTYIFTTGAPPALAHALLTAIDLIERGDALRATLATHQQQLRDTLRLAHWQRMPSTTPIQPVKIGDNAAAVAAAAALWDDGLWVPAIRPPTVPPGTARLRISLSAEHTEHDVSRLTNALHRIESTP